MSGGISAQEWTRALPQGGGAHLSRLLEFAVTSASDAVLITDAGALEEDQGGPRVVYVNDAFSRMTGYDAAEIIGRTPRMLESDATDAAQRRRLRDALDAWERVELELLIRRKDGRDFWVQLSLAPAMDADGRLTHWVSIQRDVTERRLRELADQHSLRAMRRRVRSAFENAPIGMAVATPAGVLTEVNPSLARLLGRPAEALLGRTLFDITAPAQRAAALQACRALRADGGCSRQDSRFVHADGHVMDVIVHASLVADGSGRPDHVIMHVEDVSERTALQAKLEQQALHDSLTGLPNRAMILGRLEQAVAQRNRDGSCLALLFVDIDGFKEINDELGHAAGDRVLTTLAERLRSSVRPGDTVARYGGDEFVVLCERTASAEAQIVAERLVAAAAEPLDGAPRMVATSASVGLVVADGPRPADAEDLVRDADAAMYEAKRRGRGRHTAFDGQVRARDGERRHAESRLRDALELGELRVHYQPQIHLTTEEVVGWEALARWSDPERGLLLPNEFVPYAESSGLILPLGAWVASEGWRQASEMPEATVMWINVSARQLGPGLAAQLAGLLEREGIAPARIGLEVTESVLMEDLSVARRQFAALRDLGVRLAIDDFGTGYSSLSYLAELPVDTVKVDRSFTARLEAPGHGRSVITAVLGMAGALGLDVVVEGVETPRQLAVLRELGVVLAQGFGLGEPRALHEGRGPR
jgi:diguanylate cyclase (GGDEF)-like protein/PAS domain S-box-containing protein